MPSRAMEAPKLTLPTRLIPYHKAMLAKVRPGWRRILNHPDIKPHFYAALKALNRFLSERGVSDAILEKYGLDAFILPAHTDIFSSMHHCDPQNIVGIILGQDPYPGMGTFASSGIDACGMSFSVAEGRKVPSSLSNVYAALVKSEVVSEMPTTGNLVNWAKRGMLMLNTYLTRSTNFTVAGDIATVNGTGGSDKNLIHDFWQPFTEHLLTYLTTQHLAHLNHPNHYLGIMLWGSSFAWKLEKFINKGTWKGIARDAEGRTSETEEGVIEVEVMKHGHPSGASPVNRELDNPAAFINCPHFAHFLEKVPEFNWDPAVAPTDKPSRMAQFHTALKQGVELSDEHLKVLVEEDIAYNDGTTEPHNVKVKALVEDKAQTQVKSQVPGKAPGKEKAQIEEDNRVKPSPKEVKEAKVATKANTADKPAAKPTPKPAPKPKAVKNEPAYLVLATDGGCRGNGSKRARASYGVYVPETFMGQPNVLPASATTSGQVPSLELTLDLVQLTLLESDTPIQPSNGRGELLAMIHALLLIVGYYRQHPNPQLRMIIVVDATYVIHFVNERYWRYRVKAEMGKKKVDWLATVDANKDLIRIIGQLLSELSKLRGVNPEDPQAAWDALMQPAAHDYYKNPQPMDPEWAGLTLLWQNSHRPAPDSRETLDVDKWKANNEANNLCDAQL